MLLPNGSAIKLDVIESFEKATANPENIYTSGGINWDFVSADMCMDLNAFYNFDYINDCMEALADNYFA